MNWINCIRLCPNADEDERWGEELYATAQLCCLCVE